MKMPQPKQKQVRCSHPSLLTTPSPHALSFKYKQPTPRQLQMALKPNSTANILAPPTRTDLENFPAPLVLPDDDLDLNSEQPAQPFQKWHDIKSRNKVTDGRRTIYVLAPPAVEKADGTDESDCDIGTWTIPRGHGLSESRLSKPSHQDIISYLSAFYTGITVKPLIMPTYALQPSPKTKTPQRGQKYIRLATASQATKSKLNSKSGCIRIRKSPDGIYPYQLNLGDLLNVAMDILPEDAYALCMLTDHDLYEDEEDTFTCGRAYGGRSVCIVSTARYNPLLDKEMGVEREHAWPASHCLAYINSLCELEEQPSLKKRKTTSISASKRTKYNLDRENTEQNPSPLQAAIAAFSASPITETSASLSSLYLSRITRTTSHELGHCLGIAHCTYYACIMQSSASLSEDVRQPPDLCPVDLAKVLFATGGDLKGRYMALLEFCERDESREGPHFAALGAWLRTSLSLKDRQVHGDL
ncbi:hypothetical protein BJY04DRAFT_232162 [Aspergillus karnatakaensis]|uniref:archaemetzincin n=1 Tax=Aspergillus karnatakaensis TaxID=1810916 RepID=UPI003CCE35F4